MSRAFFAAVALTAIGLTSCSVVTEFNDARYNRNNKSGDRWLSDQSEPAAVNVAGNWISGDWGRGWLVQDGRKVRGTLGGYSVRGVVSGQQVYLLIAQGDWYYYSAVLDNPQPGLLTGRFSRAIPFVRTLSRPMRLEQLAH